MSLTSHCWGTAVTIAWIRYQTLKDAHKFKITTWIGVCNIVTVNFRLAFNLKCERFFILNCLVQSWKVNIYPNCDGFFFAPDGTKGNCALAKTQRTLLFDKSRVVNLSRASAYTECLHLFTRSIRPKEIIAIFAHCECKHCNNKVDDADLRLVYAEINLAIFHNFYNVFFMCLFILYA